ncbi:hypothetical protein OHB26_30125 [Nocardia sp. NBC_01503]|uniref:hypothetical protein n=1 Tax=Nocardia sp. NBC_01503 TaxID=2975997 RepID=UPI002E7BD345|nr:hypothetical protein [Nocardia sp. NBC_01503]WTL31142.1 hypothetical protein OHB26_30125 [Nocardia sp. NBC_01503]
MSYSKLLAIAARLHPQIWEVIAPYGPARQARLTASEQVGRAAGQLPPGLDFLAGVAELAHGDVRTALALTTAVNSTPAAAVDYIAGITRDWQECGTRWPRWPWPGPFPGAGSDDRYGPYPLPWDVATIKVIVAVVFASAAARLGAYEHSPAGTAEYVELGRALAESADKLAGTAVTVEANQAA